MDSQQWISEVLKDNFIFSESKDKAYFNSFATKQNPGITLITCSDSRVCTNALLHDPVNRIFVIENIGNQLITAEGSVDYGVYHLKTPLLLISGHSDCGAVKAYMAGFDNEPEPVRKELSTLPQTMSRNPHKSSGYDHKQLIGNILKNIHFQVELAMNKYGDLVKNKKLAVVGAFYDFRNDLERGTGKLVIVNINGDSAFITYEDVVSGKETLNI